MQRIHNFVYKFIWTHAYKITYGAQIHKTKQQICVQIKHFSTIWIWWGAAYIFWEADLVILVKTVMSSSNVTLLGQWSGVPSLNHFGKEEAFGQAN